MSPGNRGWGGSGGAGGSGGSRMLSSSVMPRRSSTFFDSGILSHLNPPRTADRSLPCSVRKPVRLLIAAPYSDWPGSDCIHGAIMTWCVIADFRRQTPRAPDVTDGARHHHIACVVAMNEY